MSKRLSFSGQGVSDKSPSRPLRNGRCDDLFTVVDAEKQKPPAVVESKAEFIEYIQYDDKGEIIVDTVRKISPKNGSGFVISYTAKMCDFVAATSQGAIVRVFVYIAHNQQFGVDGKAFGYRCSHKFLQQVLGVDRKTIYNALRYLKEKFLVVETVEEGCTEFMVNPDYVTIGTDKKTRMREWNDRWARYWKTVNRPTLQTLQAPPTSQGSSATR